MRYCLVLMVWVSGGTAMTMIPFDYPTWESADQAGKDALKNKSAGSPDLSYTVVPVDRFN